MLARVREMAATRCTGWGGSPLEFNGEADHVHLLDAGVCAGVEVASSKAYAVGSTAIADSRMRRLMSERDGCDLIDASPGAQWDSSS